MDMQNSTYLFACSMRVIFWPHSNIELIYCDVIFVHFPKYEMRSHNKCLIFPSKLLEPSVVSGAAQNKQQRNQSKLLQKLQVQNECGSQVNGYLTKYLAISFVIFVVFIYIVQFL